MRRLLPLAKILPLLLAGVLAGCGEDDPKPVAKPPAPVPAALKPVTGSGPDVVLDSFEGPVGTVPAGWSFGKGRWILAEDASAARGPAVLRQEAVVPDWAVALRDGVWAGNFSAEVRFKPVSGREDASGGVVVLAQDGDNYYCCRANALEGNVRLYVVQGNRRVTLESADVTAPELGSWHSLRVARFGDILECALDGRVLLTHTLSPGKEPAWASGRIGLWTKADSVTHFDDLTVIRLPEAVKGVRP